MERVLRSHIVQLLLLSFTISNTLSHVNGRQEMHSAAKRQADTTDGPMYFSYKRPDYPRDCLEATADCFLGRSYYGAQDAGSTHPSGIYIIKPDAYSEPFEVYCNNSARGGGGWTVIQRRVDGSVKFSRTWNEFKDGFGFLTREFWLGNEKISYLTNQKSYELSIYMTTANNQHYEARYTTFRMSDIGTNYQLVTIDGFSGSGVVDGFAGLLHVDFSTHDNDNDRNTNANCAEVNNGSWWYDDCNESSNLNGEYRSLNDAGSIRWEGVGNHIKYTEMKIRPTNL